MNFAPIPNPRTGRRATIAGRRRQERKLAEERAWRESVCGGPLVEHDRPIMTSGDNALGLWEYMQEMITRSRRMEIESRLLLIAFARECWVSQDESERMIRDLIELLESVGKPHSAPTGSTNPRLQDIIRTSTTAAGTLPRL